MKLRWISFVLALMFGMSIVVSAPSVASQFNNNCASDFGTKMPVLMVHGLNGNPDIWKDDGSAALIEDTLKSVSKVDIVNPFDYERNNRDWVTNKNIGPALGAYIDCLAQNSLKNGGEGKVVVVAHSMGGLATRYAANLMVENRRVADALGLVITIGTPHEGSLLANLCEELAKVNKKPEHCQGSAIPALKVGSRELAALPPFPPSVPVKTIAGDVTINTVILPPVAVTPTYVRVPTQSDIVVSVRSASRFATESGKGDGGQLYSCDGWIPIPSYSDAPCEHNNLLKMSAVQQHVKASIEQYIQSTEVPAVPPTPILSLAFPQDPNWQVIDEPIDQAHRMKMVIRAGCTIDYKQNCPGFVVVDADWSPFGDPGTNVGDDCWWSGVVDNRYYGAAKVVETLTIDGHHVTHEELTQCDMSAGLRPDGDILHLWRFEHQDGATIVYDSDINNREPLAGLQDYLKRVSFL